MEAQCRPRQLSRIAGWAIIVVKYHPVRHYHAISDFPAMMNVRSESGSSIPPKLQRGALYTLWRMGPNSEFHCSRFCFNDHRHFAISSSSRACGSTSALWITAQSAPSPLLPQGQSPSRSAAPASCPDRRTNTAPAPTDSAERNRTSPAPFVYGAGAAVLEPRD